MKCSAGWTSAGSVSQSCIEDAHLTKGDNSSREVWGKNSLRSLERWDREFESTQGMDVCIVCVYSVFMSFCVQPCDGLIPIQGVLPTVYRIKKLKKAAKAQQRALQT
jgi:hypothetical protein